ncbi:uncharacterized protein [Aegilops tauschii subsp. strangulata]|uniref:uncharacterized protein n=1 Tax=Aegilops tauschii subsp. strangulata TaxID=200361 RepID=UPI001ABD3A75|nr:uncharacterized protein LOC120968656 [Aegilops tauschii subsp. strangulata]
MDSPQKNLGSMDAKKTMAARPFQEDDAKKMMAALLLLVTLAKKTMAARQFQEATRLASAWALVNAAHFPVSYALGSAIFYALCYLQLLCRDSCEEEDAMHRPLWIGQLCCAALQAATAALALLLPRRRRRIRRALAYLAVAVAIVNHCLLASIAHLLLIPLIVYAALLLLLLLPCRCRRICHALAYLAVAVAAVIIGCCILASFVPIAVDTGLGKLILLIVYVAAMFILAVGDLSFLALLLGGEFPWEFR